MLTGFSSRSRYVPASNLGANPAQSLPSDRGEQGDHAAERRGSKGQTQSARLDEHPCRDPPPGHLEHLQAEIEADNPARPGEKALELAGSAPEIQRDVPGVDGQAPGGGPPPPPVEA